MSLQALTAYLSLQPPGHTIDSAYQLHREYRLSEATVKVQLQSHGYIRIKIPLSRTDGENPSRSQWVKQETQLDRIEKLLLNINVLLDPTQRLNFKVFSNETLKMESPPAYTVNHE